MKVSEFFNFKKHFERFFHIEKAVNKFQTEVNTNKMRNLESEMELIDTKTKTLVQAQEQISNREKVLEVLQRSISNVEKDIENAYISSGYKDTKVERDTAFKESLDKINIDQVRDDFLEIADLYSNSLTTEDFSIIADKVSQSTGHDIKTIQDMSLEELFDQFIQIPFNQQKAEASWALNPSFDARYKRVDFNEYTPSDIGMSQSVCDQINESHNQINVDHRQMAEQYKSAMVSKAFEFYDIKYRIQMGEKLTLPDITTEFDKMVKVTPDMLPTAYDSPALRMQKEANLNNIMMANAALIECVSFFRQNDYSNIAQIDNEGRISPNELQYLSAERVDLQISLNQAIKGIEDMSKSSELLSQYQKLHSNDVKEAENTERE